MQEPEVRQIRASEIISALSYALDLTEGQAPGHSLRACILGMRIAAGLRMSLADQSDLYYALLLKDAGCSSNASRLYQILGTDERVAKRDVKLTDWTRVGWESLQYALRHVQTQAQFLERIRSLFAVAINRKRDSKEIVQIRCERGAQISRLLGFSDATASAIYSLDEHWNGGGYPRGMYGPRIPLYSRIANLAQSLEVFHRERGPAAAVKMAKSRSRSWFDPDLVRLVQSLAKREDFWHGLDDEHCMTTALAFEPWQLDVPLDEGRIDSICLGFADVIDAKTPFTYRHSNGVADTALRIAKVLSLDENQMTLLRRAALLHDIGKLAVSNQILEKPGKLDAAEWESVKRHPAHSFEILRRVPGFAQISEVAGAHHEKLDGSGYFRGLDAGKLSLEARILVVADVFDALAAKRPYRDAMPLEKVFQIIDGDTPRALDSDCVAALKIAKLDRDHAKDVTQWSESLLNLSQALAAPKPIAQVLSNQVIA